jgi:hypothetical protein
MEGCELVSTRHWNRGGGPRAGSVGSESVRRGGSFNTAGGLGATNIAKWNGTSWSALGPGIDRGEFFSAIVHSVAVSGTDVYVGGNFLGAGPTDLKNIAKWDGTQWSPLNSGVSGRQTGIEAVYALAVSGNDLYAAGNFTNAAGVMVNHIAKWDGMNWSALGSGLDDYGYALLVSEPDLFAGGAFTIAGDKASGFVAGARIGVSPPLLAILRSGSDVVLLWPSAGSSDFELEQSPNLDPPIVWEAVSENVMDDGTQKSVTIPGTNGQRFFHLRNL